MKHVLRIGVLLAAAAAPHAQNGDPASSGASWPGVWGPTRNGSEAMAGNLHVVQASPAGFTEVIRAAVFTPGATSMTGPSIAGRRIFVRNSEEIVALAIEGK